MEAQPTKVWSSISDAPLAGKSVTSRETTEPVCVRPRRTFSGLAKLLGFFGLIVVLAVALDVTINYGLRRITTSKFGSFNKVISGRVDAEIVINGSSRALVHYDPRIIEGVTRKSAYNLGMNGIQIDVQLAILKTYLKHNRKPSLVIQNIESFTFETTRKGEIYDPALYVPYLNEKELYAALLKIDPAVRKWRYIPLYGYAVEDLKFTWVAGLLGSVGVFGPENYFRGFNPRHHPWTEDFDRFRANVGDGVSYRIEPGGVAALKEVMKTCQEAGIELVLVYAPEYFEMQALEKNRSEIFATFETLCREFQIPLWDYSTSPLSRQREYFYNSQHLNARGAELFSADLSQRLAKKFANSPPKHTVQ